MKLIDTNVVIYANGSESRYKGACLKILREVAQGTVEATADAEVLQELLHFYRRRNRAPFGVTAVEQTLRIVGSVLSITGQIVTAAGELLLTYPALQARDAIHAAVMMHHRLDGIISADRSFDAIRGVTRFDPLSG